ncbi:TIGR03617 family F420-dependent LLM class oxidoreductase [Rhodococcus sp. SGAir0479]|uniref:TIGR03617 family F420-dependent LLM class oxidoreductase n=1 Tax=Rhodococcus sp. SGAir0479 TaxID=2567884 RepID=UPI0010CD3DD5|nr:TIGR03617 family F420-dependent LLM class oxidoreductase [Rhodococcus sp. SGAir0479]QCQ90564.1 TIGR03617 family F420-dependent LLM class oxidoreductase [Rhodococcus sp. SGAir0479]
MKVFTGTDAAIDPAAVAGFARRAEAAGYDGLHVSETVHDPFLLALLALQATERIVVRTSVALAFVRSPLLTAYTAWDLSRMSGGRFHLGLGSQIRQNIEERYAMEWSAPAARMRDYVGVVRAAFESFRTGELVPYEGERYRFTRMQPYFNPGPDQDTVTPPIYLGAVGRRMLAVAGATADGLITHPTNSDPQFLFDECRPALAEGAAAAGRSLDGFDVVAGLQVITGATDADVAAERDRRRRLFAFLYSTPAYRGALVRHGFPDLQAKLADRVRCDDWERLEDIVTDEVLATIVPTARYDALAGAVRERLDGIAQSVTLALPENADQDRCMADVIAELHAG